MGMTIDENIRKLSEILEEATEDENAVCYVTELDAPIFKMAIETMRKYQKIQQIIAMDDKNHRRTIRIADLKEVLEDDKI